MFSDCFLLLRRKNITYAEISKVEISAEQCLVKNKNNNP